MRVTFLNLLLQNGLGIGQLWVRIAGTLPHLAFAAGQLAVPSAHQLHGEHAHTHTYMHHLHTYMQSHAHNEWCELRVSGFASFSALFATLTPTCQRSAAFYSKAPSQVTLDT
jgi:hypothetical protein